MTMATIPNKNMGNATGLVNMLRNIGGSIRNCNGHHRLIRRSALHQTYLGANLTPNGCGPAAKVRRHRRLSRPSRRPRPGAPRLLWPDLRADAAAVRDDGLRGRLPLDRGAGLHLRDRRMAFQKARQACCTAAGDALRKGERNTISLSAQFTPPPQKPPQFLVVSLNPSGKNVVVPAMHRQRSHNLPRAPRAAPAD